MDRAEQCGPCGGQGHEVVLARRSGRRLRGRLGDSVYKRQEQARDEGLVEGVDGLQGFVQSFYGSGEQVGAHHATARVGGKNCISGNGAVTGACSR